MFLKILVCGLLIAFCGTLNLFAQDGCGAGGYFHAWVVDKAPKSLDVRDQPSVKGKILATVKTTPFAVESEGYVLITVVITGYSNGWWKITSAWGDEDSLFEGNGWVSANMAGEIKGSNGEYNNKPAGLYAASNSKRKIGTIAVGDEVLITDFTCGWLKVKYKRKIGWVKALNVCGSPYTSCS